MRAFNALLIGTTAALLSLLPRPAAAQHEQPRDKRVGVFLDSPAGMDAKGVWLEVSNGLPGSQVIPLSSAPRSLLPRQVVKFCQDHGVDRLGIVRPSTDELPRRLVFQAYDSDGQPIQSRVLATTLRPARLQRPSDDSFSSDELQDMAHAGGPDFYRAVGRADLADRYATRSTLRQVGGGLGAAFAVTGLLFLASGPLARAVVPCFDSPCTSHGDPFAVTGGLLLAGGGVLVISSLVTSTEPLDEQGRVALEQRYEVEHARHQSTSFLRVTDLHVAGSPTPRGEGGLMVVSGRF